MSGPLVPWPCAPSPELQSPLSSHAGHRLSLQPGMGLCVTVSWCWENQQTCPWPGRHRCGWTQPLASRGVGVLQSSGASWCLNYRWHKFLAWSHKVSLWKMNGSAWGFGGDVDFVVNSMNSAACSALQRKVKGPWDTPHPVEPAEGAGSPVQVSAPATAPPRARSQVELQAQKPLSGWGVGG